MLRFRRGTHLTTVESKFQEKSTRLHLSALAHTPFYSQLYHGCFDRSCAFVYDARLWLARMGQKNSIEIERLVSRLSSLPMWENGTFPTLNLPATASTEQVVTRVFRMTGFDKQPVTNHRIIETCQVQIPSSFMGFYTAVLVDTPSGRKIVLLACQKSGAGWWSRVFDVKTSG